MKTAQQSAQKFASRAAGASGDYVEGARTTTKDQSANAIAAKEVYKQSLQESFTRDAYSKGLGKSGKAGWVRGVTEKGGNRFAEGVSQGESKYATESAKYDGARNAAASMPRGIKGSETNFARSKAVALAQRVVKTGK